MLFRLKTNKVVPTIPTVGFNAEEVQVSGISILMWDLGGQAKIRSLWEHYTQDISGVVFVVDASDKGRLKEGRFGRKGLEKFPSLTLFASRTAHDEMYRILRSPDLSKVKPLLIMANKQDQPSSMSAQEVSVASKQFRFWKPSAHPQFRCVLH
jgi:ADP-ribosylation factor protein 1